MSDTEEEDTVSGGADAVVGGGDVDVSAGDVDGGSSAREGGAAYGAFLQRTPLLNLLRGTVKRARLRRLEAVLLERCGSVQLLLENLQDPRNSGVILRSADAFGVHHVHIVERFLPFVFDPISSREAERYLRLHRYEDAASCARRLKEQGFVLVATTLSKEAHSVHNVDFIAMKRLCVLFGNEDRGVSDELLSYADVQVRLPMRGMVQSLNVSASAAQLLYHLRACNRLRADLDADERNAAYLRWVINNSPNPKNLVARHGLDCWGL